MSAHQNKLRIHNLCFGSNTELVDDASNMSTG
nr:MAG TPA: hypothetical protein [Caudoviricetes sp.]